MTVDLNTKSIAELVIDFAAAAGKIASMVFLSDAPLSD